MGCSGSVVLTQLNWIVLRAGMSTVEIRTALSLCSSSVVTDSVKPCTACLAAQYAACRGMPRWARADPTWMT
jgi:hypothetical protein